MAPVWESAFLKALERCGVASEAARLAGTGVRNAFKRRKGNPTFAAAWDAAVAVHRAELGRQAMMALADEGLAFNSGPDGAKMIAAGQSRWSKRSEEAFLIALSTSGSVSRAAKAAGFSTAALYKRRLKDRHFTQAWDAALETGKAHVQSFLVEAATRTFDPDELPMADEHEIPKVTVSEAINIAKMPGRSPASPGSGGAARGRWHDGRFIEDDYVPTPEERQEVTDRILAKLEGLKSRNDRMMIEAGWTEHEVPPLPCYDSEEPGSVWIPPGWRLVRDA